MPEEPLTPSADMPRDRVRRRLLKALALGAAAPPMLLGDTPPRMHYRPIPATGEQLPVIGLSASKLFDVGPDPLVRAGPAAAIAELHGLDNAVIETSPLDGRAEAVVGELLAAVPRERVFLAGKVWSTGPAGGEEQMRTSLSALRTDHFDLMQVHNLVDWRRHLVTLRTWQARGWVRYIGVTHYHRDALPLLLRILNSEQLDFVQINYSILEPEAESQLLPLAQNRKVAVIASHPFADGRLFRAVLGRPLPDWAARYGIDSWPALFLKYVVSHPAVTCALAGAANGPQMRENLAGGLGLIPNVRERRRLAARVREL